MKDGDTKRRDDTRAGLSTRRGMLRTANAAAATLGLRRLGWKRCDVKESTAFEQVELFPGPTGAIDGLFAAPPSPQRWQRIWSEVAAA